MTNGKHDPNESASPEDLTRLLNRAASGDETAARRVIPRIYAELKQIARAKRRRAGSGETLRTTALVHEAYLRVVGREPEGWKARSHFFFAAARAMRDILVEDARRRASGKHGGDLDRIPLDEAGLSIEASPDRVLDLDRLLDRLETEDELAHQIVLYRFFVGLSMPEIAEVTGTALRSIERKWTFTRSWLASELGRD